MAGPDAFQAERRACLSEVEGISRLAGPARTPNCTTTEIQNLRKFKTFRNPNLDGFSRKTSDREAYKKNTRKKKQWWLSLGPLTTDPGRNRL
jgi:hypothetical protein